MASNIKIHFRLTNLFDLLRPLQLVHFGLCEMNCILIGNNKYFFTFIDNFSKKTWCIFQRKNQTFSMPSKGQFLLKMKVVSTSVQCRQLIVDVSTRQGSLPNFAENYSKSKQTGSIYDALLSPENLQAKNWFYNYFLTSSILACVIIFRKMNLISCWVRSLNGTSTKKVVI